MVSASKFVIEQNIRNYCQGSFRAAQLIGRLEHFLTQPRYSQKGIYVFMEPCNHYLYKDGDSLTEILGCGESTLRKIRKKYMKIYNSKDAFEKARLAGEDISEGKPYYSYYDRDQRVTFIFRNHALADILMKEIRGDAPATNHAITSCQTPGITQNLVDRASRTRKKYDSRNLENYESTITKKHNKETIKLGQIVTADKLSVEQESQFSLVEKEILRDFNAVTGRNEEWNPVKLSLLHREMAKRPKWGPKNFKKIFQTTMAHKFYGGKVITRNGEPFVLNLTYLLNNIDKLLKEFGLTDIVIEKVITKKDVEKEIEASHESTLIQWFRKSFLTRVGVEKYKAWMEEVVIKERGKSLTLEATTEFKASWLSQQLWIELGHVHSVMRSKVESLIILKKGNTKEKIIKFQGDTNINKKLAA